MSIPVNFADKIQMKAYREFEDAAHSSIAICRFLFGIFFLKLFKYFFYIARNLIAILSNEMQSSEVGLLRKMRAQQLSDDMILRIFSDLIIAAGDTVSF